MKFFWLGFLSFPPLAAFIIITAINHKNCTFHSSRALGFSGTLIWGHRLAPPPRPSNNNNWQSLALSYQHCPRLQDSRHSSYLYEHRHIKRLSNFQIDLDLIRVLHFFLGALLFIYILFLSFHNFFWAARFSYFLFWPGSC